MLLLWTRQNQHSLIVFLICAMTVGSIWHRAHISAQAEHAQRLDRAADVISEQIGEQFLAYERLLYIARALFDASREVTRSDWEVFCRGLELGANTPGLYGFGYVAKVEPADAASFVLRARADGAPDFRIRPHRNADRDNTGYASYVVLYSEPSDRNSAVLGVDVATFTPKREIYHEAARDGAVRIGAGLSLMQTGPDQPALFAALPVYSPPQPQGRVVGWVVAALTLENYFDRARTPDWDGKLLSVSIQEGNESWQVHETKPGTNGTDTDPYRNKPRLARTRDIDLFGKNMQIVVTPAREDLRRADLTEANVVLLVGSLATALLTLIAWSATRTRQRAVSIARQMTESLRLSEQRQRELAEKAEQANQAKSEFLANMSHEIRTPMTAILGYTDIIEGAEVQPGERAEALRAIRGSGNHLLNIINDVLDLSKIESGRLEVAREETDVGTLINDCLASLRQKAEHKGLTLAARFESPVPDRVLTDAHRVRQILINLVGNAIKFTEIGGVELGVGYRNDRIQLSVHDTGVGIPREKLELVFQPFEQADNSMTRRHEGTGLGLTISRRLAGLLGGHLTATSRENIGSVFTLDIPAPAADNAKDITALPRTAPAPAPEVRPVFGLTGTRVLLAEDGPDNQKLISFILRKAGLEVDVVNNGREAVDRIAGGHTYDLLITDMQMPEMDGYAATRLLRADGYKGPILALTAHAMEGDREHCLEAGCDDYQTKPIDRGALLGAIERLVGQRAAETSVRAA